MSDSAVKKNYILHSRANTPKSRENYSSHADGSRLPRERIAGRAYSFPEERTPPGGQHGPSSMGGTVVPSCRLGRTAARAAFPVGTEIENPKRNNANTVHVGVVVIAAAAACMAGIASTWQVQQVGGQGAGVENQPPFPLLLLDSTG